MRIELAGDGEQMRALARQAVAEGCDALVAGGGDGTVNLVASAVAGTAVPLGIIPLGTLNPFSKDLGIPANLDEAVAIVLAGEVRQVDVGEVNGHLFLNNSSIGEGCIIAAGSVVPENTVIPPRTLWAGVPAKMRREITDKDYALIREYAQTYLDYAEIYLKEPAN